MKIGIVGCGLIGQKRATAASGQVAIVCDTNIERATSLASRTGADAVEDWRKVIESNVDAVIVATTHDNLAEISRAAAEARKHVLVEKPAGRNLAEAASVRDAAKLSGVVAKVGFNHRFHPGLSAAKDIAGSGALGPLYYIRGRYGHGGRVGYEKEWRCQPEMSGGGELIDQGSHLIDLSRWFLGDLVLDYAATPTFFWDIAVDDNCFLALRGAKDELAWLHATWTEWKNMFSFEIVGRDGKLTIDGLGGSYGVERLTHHKMLPQMGPPETVTWEYPFPDTSWQREFESFAAAVEGRPARIADISDACAVLAIVEEAYAGARR
jgi:predicted dehydrogenase